MVIICFTLLISIWIYTRKSRCVGIQGKVRRYAKYLNHYFIGNDAAGFGQNIYFYDAAEGLLTATIYYQNFEPQKRHRQYLKSYKLLAPSQKKGKSVQQLSEMLPDDHKANGLQELHNTAEQSMASVMSTALSRLNLFLIQNWALLCLTRD